jgi:hypothetical protein
MRFIRHGRDKRGHDGVGVSRRYGLISNSRANSVYERF